MTEQSYCVVHLTGQHIIWCKAYVEDVVAVKLLSQCTEITDGIVDEVLLCHNSGILVDKLFERDKVPHLYGDGIDAIVTLIGFEVQLVAIADIIHRSSFVPDEVAERDMVGYLVVELDKV